MKRSPPPRRRTPLKRRGKRSDEQRPWTADEDVERMAAWRLEVFAQAGSRCVARVAPDCRGWAEHAHHLAGRIGDNDDGDPLRYDPANGIALCHNCHAWVHNHPEQSYAAGWMVHRLH